MRSASSSSKSNPHISFTVNEMWGELSLEVFTCACPIKNWWLISSHLIGDTLSFILYKMSFLLKQKEHLHKTSVRNVLDSTHFILSRSKLLCADIARTSSLKETRYYEEYDETTTYLLLIRLDTVIFGSRIMCMRMIRHEKREMNRSLFRSVW